MTQQPKSGLPVVDVRALRGLDDAILRVTDARVEVISDRALFVLEIDNALCGSDQTNTIPYALSPPAAARLSRLLDDAVQKYLYQSETED